MRTWSSNSNAGRYTVQILLSIELSSANQRANYVASTLLKTLTFAMWSTGSREETPLLCRTIEGVGGEDSTGFQKKRETIHTILEGAGAICAPLQFAYILLFCLLLLTTIHSLLLIEVLGTVSLSFLPSFAFMYIIYKFISLVISLAIYKSCKS